MNKLILGFFLLSLSWGTCFAVGEDQASVSELDHGKTEIEVGEFTKDTLGASVFPLTSAMVAVIAESRIFPDYQSLWVAFEIGSVFGTFAGLLSLHTKWNPLGSVAYLRRIQKDPSRRQFLTKRRNAAAIAVLAGSVTGVSVAIGCTALIRALVH